MKMIRTLLFLISISLAQFLNAQSTCFADYSFLQNGTSIDFFASTTPNITNVIWDFGDGNFDYTNNQNPNHIYAGPGTYTACILYSDTNSNCSDSTCHTIIIDSCYATLNYTQNGNTFNFTGYANGSSPNTVYVWNFGDATGSSQQNPTHTYTNIGIYTVCFAYYDLTTGCSDSICTQVQFGNCNADFVSIDSMGYIFFVNTSTLGNSGYYYWDFGDGNYSSQFSPSNIYAQPGTYLVCLTAYDSAQTFCDSTCHYITVTNLIGVNENGNEISELSVAPNPADGITNLSFYLFHESNVQISITDIFGRTVKEISTQHFSSGKQTLNLNTNDFASGVYFVKSNVNGQIINTRMVVSH